MPTVKELMHAGRKDELWQMCCGFLDLNIEQFMSIQKRLLLEQIELLNRSVIGRKIFGTTIPQDVEEFRKRAPLTTYQNYCPELSEKREDALPAKPILWQHTSGRSNEFPFKWESIKWMPVTAAMCSEFGKIGGATSLLASCKRRGDASALKKGAKFIYAVAPRPYTSGTYAFVATEELDGVSLPTLEQAEKMEFEDRIAISFKQALSKGFDYYFGITVALVTIGERMGDQMSSVKFKTLLSQPSALFRVVRGLIKSKLAKRKLLPKDLWDIKGIMGSGTDATIFGQLIKDTWGKYPLNVYGSTEAGIVGVQTWDFGTMSFYPSLDFFEFIPEPEYLKWQSDNSYNLKTVLLDEVKAGEKYELVITNFHGGPLIRYRTGDILKISSLRNDKLNINTPQMEFDGRIDDVLDIGGFIRLTEKVIWQAISNTGVPCVEWTARREARGKGHVLHLYMELKDSCTSDVKQIAVKVYEELKKMDEGFMYGDIESILNTMPVEVSTLPKGAFANYMSMRRAQGADLAHLKPKHINISEKEIGILQGAAPEKIKVEKVSIGAPVAR
ncbi:MAG: GH3 auxin-responsive promoter family protein [Chloroflexi bacterium]|nr:GH3 auxin-responsive promoter family protein [Chloroflexota bacterium]